MAQHIWTVPCRLSTVDRESNNVSLIQVLEEIAVPTVPPVQPSLALFPAIFDVVTLWGRDDENSSEGATGRMSLVSPTGEALIVTEYEIDLRESRRFRAVSRILGFPTQTSGTYKFRIERRSAAEGEWEYVAAIPLVVTILTQNGQAHSRENTAPQ
jgi:hypothetical protein